MVTRKYKEGAVMREVFIFAILETAIFGTLILLFKTLLIFFPEKLEREKHLSVQFIGGVEENTPGSSPEKIFSPESFKAQTSSEVSLEGQLQSKRAVLTSLLEKQASISKGVGHVRHLNTLEDHRATLRNALEQAARRVVIVSPFLSVGAVKADRVSALIRSAVGRGVEVLVFTDRKLNLRKDGSINKASREGQVMLEAAGATVFVVDGIHNKTLCMDDKVIIEGSFNWLSAMRNKNHDHHRHENSMMVIGGDASRLITKQMRAMAQLALKVAA
jgi:hypothetical protein